VALVVEYHEELELDLHDQRVDLLDFWRGTLTARRLGLLVRNLPPTSRFVQAINPDVAEAAAWDVGNYQTAALYDLIAHAHFKDPKPFPRPLDAIREREAAQSRHEALLAQRERQAERARLRAAGELG
jgi:hypothetical protein